MTHDTFHEPVFVKGHRHRWEADLDWTLGPASVRTEYTWVIDDRLQQGLGEQDLPAARAQSWYVSGSWILTGEPKTRPVKPAREFLGMGGARWRWPVVLSASGSTASVRQQQARHSVTRAPKTSSRATFGS